MWLNWPSGSTMLSNTFTFDSTGDRMASLHVRNLDEEVIRKLKERAIRNGRSAEAEHREILKSVLFWDTPDARHGESLSWEERAEHLRRGTMGRQHTPSEILIREDRDSR